MGCYVPNPNLNEIHQSPVELLMTNDRFFVRFRGCSITAMGVKTRGLICTKVGRNIVKSSLHTMFKNGGDTLLGFQTTAAQRRPLVSDKATNRTFWPPVKIRKGVGEMSRLILVASPIAEPLVYICWPASPQVLRTSSSKKRKKKTHQQTLRHSD